MASTDPNLVPSNAQRFARGRHLRGRAPSDSGRARERPQDVVLIGIVVALGAALSLLVVRSEVVADPVLNGVVRALLVGSWGAVGLITSRKRPESRLGTTLVGVSWLYSVTSLIGFRDPSLFTIGRVTAAFLTVALAYAFLSFPTGRLGDRRSVAVVSGALVATVLVWIPLVLGANQLPRGNVLTRCAAACPSNPFRLFTLDAGAERALSNAATAIAGVTLLAAAVAMLAHTRSLSRLRRRAFVLPVAFLSWGALASALAALVRLSAGDTSAARTLGWVGVAAFLTFPYALLLAQARGKLFAETAMRRATAHVARHEPHADLRSTLAEALDDPSLEIGFQVAGHSGYVDAAGRRVDVGRSESRAVTRIVQNGRPVAVIVHDPLLDEVPGLVLAAGEAALLVLDNVRLESELRGAIDELRASRARIVAATEAERRRLEQDLHDSAQQRLVALRIRLGLAEDRAAELSEDMRAVLAELGEETEEAIESVRSVAQGIYPPLLAGGGLARALTAEARRMPVRAHVAADEIGRAAPDLEAAVYFCCIEALQNSVKHGGPDIRITTELHRQNGELAFSVRDDGAGFDAAATSGTGLTNMRDRIGGVGGSLQIASTPGEGTVVAGTVPWKRERLAIVPGAQPVRREVAR